MTALQRKEFELLQCFVKICKDLKLTYFLVCGSALGAAKYKGFIPWDDDIDVGMAREDYEIFLKEAPKHLPEEYFLQNYKTDPNFSAIYSKLRNSNTTYIEKSSAKLSINHGVYIDIFPLDGYPKVRLAQKWLEFRKRIYAHLIVTAFDADLKGISKALDRVLKLLGYHKRTAKAVDKYTKMISKYKIEDSDLICNFGNWQGVLEYAPKEQYGKGLEAEFEGLKVYIPERYDEYLSQKYGDWRADLPDDQKEGHHYYSVCDLERPYTYYINKD